MTDFATLISFIDAALAEADCEQRHGIQLCDLLREVRRHLERCAVGCAAFNSPTEARHDDVNDTNVIEIVAIGIHKWASKGKIAWVTEDKGFYRAAAKAAIDAMNTTKDGRAPLARHPAPIGDTTSVGIQSAVHPKLLAALKQAREANKKAIELLMGDMVASAIEVLEKESLAAIDAVMGDVGASLSSATAVESAGIATRKDAAREAPTNNQRDECRKAFEEWYEENVSACFVEGQVPYHDYHAVFGHDVKAAWSAAIAHRDAELISLFTESAVRNHGITLDDCITIIKRASK